VKTPEKDLFAQFRTEESPAESDLARISELATALEAAQVKVAKVEKELKDAQEVERQISEKDLPTLMDSLKLAKFTTSGGVSIEVDTIIRASIGKRKAEAHAWLEENGHGALIKRTIEVAFNREDGDKAKILLEELEGEGYAGVKQELKVEPATLTAWVREQLEAGQTVPADIFGIFEQRIARVTRSEE